MRIYLIKPTADATYTASAECDKRAAALIARGYTRCTLGYWRAVRRVNERRDFRRLAAEDRLERQNTLVMETAPLGAVLTIRS